MKDSSTRTRGIFFQLTGHKESFKKSHRPEQTILKKATGNELKCLSKLMEEGERLSKFVPKLYDVIKEEEDDCLYLEIENLLTNFTFTKQDEISVMDIKLGTRTYREGELNGDLKDKEQSSCVSKLRPDMYEKMVQVDKDEPTREENLMKAITKPRYMIWRETLSSTATLGFRIEAMKLAHDSSIRMDFKTTKLIDQVKEALKSFTELKKKPEPDLDGTKIVDNYDENLIRLMYLNRLYSIRDALNESEFFKTHELIGISLLFVHNNNNEASIWLIDFAKTHSLPTGVEITHKKRWELGNHEDGFLTGIENLIRIFESMIEKSDDQQPTTTNFYRNESLSYDDANMTINRRENNIDHLNNNNNNNNNNNSNSNSNTRQQDENNIKITTNGYYK